MLVRRGRSDRRESPSYGGSPQIDSRRGCLAGAGHRLRRRRDRGYDYGYAVRVPVTTFRTTSRGVASTVGTVRPGALPCPLYHPRFPVVWIRKAQVSPAARTDPTVAAFVPSGAAVLPDHRIRPGGGSRLGSPGKGEICKRVCRYTVTVPSPTVRGTAPGVFVHCPDPPRSPCNRGGFGLQTQVCNRSFRLSITDAPIGTRAGLPRGRIHAHTRASPPRGRFSRASAPRGAPGLPSRRSPCVACRHGLSLRGVEGDGRKVAPRAGRD